MVSWSDIAYPFTMSINIFYQTATWGSMELELLPVQTKLTDELALLVLKRKGTADTLQSWLARFPSYRELAVDFYSKVRTFQAEEEDEDVRQALAVLGNKLELSLSAMTTYGERMTVGHELLQNHFLYTMELSFDTSNAKYRVAPDLNHRRDAYFQTGAVKDLERYLREAQEFAEAHPDYLDKSHRGFEEYKSAENELEVFIMLESTERENHG